MRFGTFGASVLLLLACASPAVAQDGAAEPGINLQIRNVRGNLYMIDDVKGAQGKAGGNVGVLIGADGVVLVDSMKATAAPKIPAVLATITSKPVRFVITTHRHPDHQGGFGFFGPNSTLIAHANTYRSMASAVSTGDPVAPPAAWPDLLVFDQLTLHQNDETIDIRHYPRAHTDTDLVVFFRKANVVQMGDTYFPGEFPLNDTDGHIDGVIALFEDVLAQTDARTLFIPGHGPVSRHADLSATLAMLKETRALAEDGIKRGLSVEQLVEPKVVERFESWSHGYLDTPDYFSYLYEVLKGS